MAGALDGPTNLWANAPHPTTRFLSPALSETSRAVWHDRSTGNEQTNKEVHKTITQWDM